MVIDAIGCRDHASRQAGRKESEILLQLTEEQVAELRGLMRTASEAYVRRKATAVWNLSEGRSQREVAHFLGVSKTSVGNWAERFQAEGGAGFKIRPGRGPKSRADLAEVTELIRQSPRTFGLDQTRWTLPSLARVAPSLQGFTPSGVWRVLQRAKLHYKRGQPRLTSPDPEYVQKRAAPSSASRSERSA